MAKPETERISELEGSFKILIQMTEELKDEVKGLRSDLVEQINELRDIVQKLENKLTAHEQSFATKEHLHRLELKVKEIESNYKNMTSKLNDVEKNSNMRYEELDRRIDDIKNQLENIHGLLDNTSNQLSAITSAFEERQNSERAMLAKVSVLSAVIGTLISVAAFLISHHP